MFNNYSKDLIEDSNKYLSVYLSIYNIFKFLKGKYNLSAK